MKELYKKLYESGEYTKSYEEFVSQYGTPDKAQKLYKGLNEAGDYTKSFDEFLNRYKFDSSEVKKKVTSEPISTDQELDSTSILGGRLTPVVTGEVEELDVITPAVEVKSSNSYMSDLLVKAQSPERADKYKEKLNYKSDNPVYVDGKVDLIEDPVLKEKLSQDYNIQTALKIGVIDQEDIDLALKGDIDSIKKIQEISTLSNKEINEAIKAKRLDVTYAYETSSDLQANIKDPKEEIKIKEALKAISVFDKESDRLIKENPDADGKQLYDIRNRKGPNTPTQEQYDLVENIETTGFEDSVIDSMYDVTELSKIEGFNTIDFDGHLKEQGYQEKYQQLLAGEVVSEEGVDVYFAGTHNPNLAAERLKLQYLTEYVGNQLQRNYDFQVLDYKSKNNGHHPALDGVEINPTSGINEEALTKYIEKSFPIVTAKLKNQDIKNQEIYQQHKNGDIRFFEDLMKQGWRSLEDRINNFSSSTYDMIGMDNVAEGIRMGKAETAMGRTGLLRYTFASGKQADVGGTQYLVDENNQIYDVDRKIAVSEVLNPFEAKKIIETVNDIGEKNWSISPTGGAVATAGIVTDMVAQIALTRGVGVLGQGVKGLAVGYTGLKTGGAAINLLSKIPIKATTASAMIAQGTLFSSNLYEQARIQSIDAGLTVQQADEMAAMAGRQGFVLGFFTAPLSTQTYAMNKVFGSGPSEKIIKGAIDAYKRGGSKAVVGFWKKAGQRSLLYSREGIKETFQENIQQVGQTYGIGSNVNEAAGVDVMKQNITMDEVINTTILSFTAGMIMPMGGDVFSSRRKTTPGMDAIEKLKSLDILSKDPEKTRELLNSQVNKGVYTEDQVESILADIEMYRTSVNSIPTNLSAEISLSVMPDISEINKLKNLKESQEPAFHPAIDKKIAELRNSIVKKTFFDKLSNKAKKDLKNKAMNELLNESEERGETDIELNDNVIIERAIENFSTQEVVEDEETNTETQSDAIERKRQEAKDNPVSEPSNYAKAVDEYKQTDLGGGEVAKDKKNKVVEESQTEEGKAYVENTVAQLEHNEDGTITLYRSGTIQDGHNPATTNKKIAEILAKERKEQGLSSDIVEVRVKPEDISVVVPGVENEVFIEVNENNKSRISENTKEEQKTKEELISEKEAVEKELEETEEALNRTNKAIQEGTDEMLPAITKNKPKLESKIKNLQWQLKKYDAKISATSDATGLPTLKPVPSVSTMATEDVKVDAKRFQFKDGTDKEGATDKLKGRKYNPELAGVVSVWKDPENGETYVINGHHRLALAKENGVKVIDVRNIEAENAGQARLIGARQNIAEGQGTDIDAAKVFRESGDTNQSLKDEGISLSDSKARNGLALANLSEDLFRLITKGTLKPSVGVIIGENINDKDIQEQFYNILKGKNNISNATIKIMAQDINDSKTETVEVVDLFGTTKEEFAKYEDRANLISGIRTVLGKVKNLLGKVAKNEDLLSEYGNEIDVAKSEGVSKEAAIALGVFDKLRNTNSTIKNIIDNAVKRIENGESKSKVRSETAKQLTESIPKILEGGVSKNVETSDNAKGKQQKPKAVEEKPLADKPKKTSEEKEISEKQKDTKKTQKSSKKTTKAPVKKEVSGFNIRKLFSGMPVLSYLDDLFYQNITKKIDAATAAIVTKAIDSKSKFKRIIGQTATNWFNGLPRTTKELARSRRLKGEQDVAVILGAKLTKTLQDIIGSNPESASRVHAVLDPEIYEDVSITYEELTDREKLLYDELKKINAKTHELNYKEGFIDKKTYDKYKGKYIARLYEEYENNEFTGAKNKIDFNPYKERQAIDQWKIDNKVEDPIYLTISRMIRTGRNVAVKSYAESIANSEKASKTEKKGYVLMDDKRYGKLNGMYVPHYISEDFQGYSFSNKAIDVLYDRAKAYDRLLLRQVLKKSHTVWNPVVQTGNLLSNFAFAFVTGANPVQVASNLARARKAIKTQNEVYLILVKNGLIGSNVATNDQVTLTETGTPIYDALAKLMSNKSNIDSKSKAKAIWQKVTSPLVKADNFATNTYGASDDIMKIATYMSLKDAGYSESEAIEKVFDGLQNYATVGKIWDASSKTPVIGNAYVKFQADLMRITKNAIIKRPLSTTAFLASLKALALVASLLSGEDEEDKEIREGRPYIPKIKTPIMDIPLVFKIGKKEINLARYISPYYTFDIPDKDNLETITGPMPYSFFHIEGKEKGSPGIPLFKAQDVLLGPLVQAFVYDKDFRNQSISDPYATRYKESGLTEFQKLMNKIEYVGRSNIPASSSIQDLYLSATTGEDYYGRSKTVSDVAISQIIKIQTFDKPEYEKVVENKFKNLLYEGRLIDDKIKSVESAFNKQGEKYNKKVSDGKMSKEQANKNMIKLYNKSIKTTDEHLKSLIKIQNEINAFSKKLKDRNLKNK